MAYKARELRYDNMKYNRCGASGLLLPAVSLGLWHNFGDKDDAENMKDMLFTAFDLGITHFDLANNYGPKNGAAEKNFGKILKSDLRAYRDEIIISTKAGYPMWEGPYGSNGSRKYMLASLDQSLKRMNLDYVDIFYHHRPDSDTPLEESMYALNTAVKSGKALYAGISRYDKETTAKAMQILKELKCPFIVNQVRYSLFDRQIEETGLKAYAGQSGIGLIAFSPLAQGILSDKYLKGTPLDSRAKRDGHFLKEDDITPQKLAKISELNDIALNRGQTLAQMALAWVLKDSDITSVLIGASKPEQIAENVKVVGKTVFTKEELIVIDEIISRDN